MKNQKVKANMSNQKGITIIEVLVTLVVTVIGLLGSLQIQGQMQKSLQESYNRTQATLVMRDIQDRIFSNKPSAPCYAIQGFLGTGNTSVPVCSGAGSEATQGLAEQDLKQINALLSGFNEINENGEFVGGLLRGRACITLVESPGLQTYNITIVWQGLNNISSNSTAECGGDAYGEDGFKRIYQSSLNIARLSGV